MKQNQNTLHTEKVLLNDKAFFLDLKEAKNGRTYLVITQTKPIEDEKYERIKMILFESEIQKFNEGLTKVLASFTPKEKTDYSDEYIAKTRKTYPMAFHVWTKEEEELLIALFNEGKTTAQLSTALKRQKNAITARLHKLGLTEATSVA